MVEMKGDTGDHLNRLKYRQTKSELLVPDHRCEKPVSVSFSNVDKVDVQWLVVRAPGKTQVSSYKIFSSSFPILI